MKSDFRLLNRNYQLWLVFFSILAGFVTFGFILSLIVDKGYVYGIFVCIFGLLYIILTVIFIDKIQPKEEPQSAKDKVMEDYEKLLRLQEEEAKLFLKKNTD